MIINGKIIVVAYFKHQLQPEQEFASHRQSKEYQNDSVLTRSHNHYFQNVHMKLLYLKPCSFHSKIMHIVWTPHTTLNLFSLMTPPYKVKYLMVNLLQYHAIPIAILSIFFQGQNIQAFPSLSAFKFSFYKSNSILYEEMPTCHFDC